MKGGPSQAQINAQKKAQQQQVAQMQKAMAQQARQQQQAMAAMSEAAAGVAAPTFETPPPAAQSTSADILAAQADARGQAKGRYGLTRTRRAGDTGGFKNTLLGGGESKLGGSTLLTTVS